MPSLEFKGKQFVYAHHLGVPFRTLDIVEEKSCPAPGQTPTFDDNLIIHGDNLHALKALLPTYAGRIKCIFIDPPYNTGEEGWCYNDNVRSPQMQQWLKQSANPVDKEDLERHDKWLCMMWPRLHLLRELLHVEGVLFMTIDDNEAHRARCMLDEVFQGENFVASVVWQKRTSPDARKALSWAHDHLLVYANSKALVDILKLELGAERESDYTNPDNDPRGPWASVDLTGQTGHATADQFFNVTLPSGNVIAPPEKRCWALAEKTYTELLSDNRIWFGVDGTARPRLKKFLSESEGKHIWTWWPNTEAGSNQEATKEVNAIIGTELEFDNPKPTRLVIRALQLCTDMESIVLDSFAGSGTTAHAVLALNQRDRGNRRFICIECEDYADTLTAERVRRAINGYGFTGTQREELYRVKLTPSALKKMPQYLQAIDGIEKMEAGRFDRIKREVKDNTLVVMGEKDVEEKTEGLGGSFTYCELGQEINLENLLRGGDLPSYEMLGRYVYHTATGQTLQGTVEERENWWLGETTGYDVFLLYRPDREWLRSNDAILDRTRAQHIAACGDGRRRKLVFAAAKFVGQKELTAIGVEFCQLPYAIYRVLGE